MSSSDILILMNHFINFEIFVHAAINSRMEIFSIWYDTIDYFGITCYDVKCLEFSESSPAGPCYFYLGGKLSVHSSDDVSFGI